MMASYKQIAPPDDFEDAEEFLSFIREAVDDDLTDDRRNRDASLEDSKFFIGDQWDPDVKLRRRRKPTLTNNRLPAFVAQVLGNRLLNETVIKVLPDNGGTKVVARIREGLIRSIQKVTRAEAVYNNTHQNQVVCGIGNFQVELEYADDDVFEQDIKIASLPNPLSVVWDRMSIDSTGADADHVTVLDTMPRKTFDKEYPDCQPTEIQTDMAAQGWFENNTVRVASFWRMRKRKRMLALFQDGSVQDVTDKPEETWAPMVVIDQSGRGVVREADRRYAELYIVSGTHLLDGPYELPISRLPIFRVPGWEVNVGEEKHRWGLVRFLKDPQRLHNYWRSVIAEKLMLSPKARWVASDAAVSGREKEWRNAHLSDDPLLVYSAESGAPPTYTPPAQMEVALIHEAATSTQDLKDISNLHDASLGAQSNEVSGKAIIARQRVGELGTVLYQTNLNAAIEQCGIVINQLIPHVYSGPRIIKILGPDDKDELVAINAAGNPDAIDITVGKYSVTVTTGPSYTTKRVEAAESMLNLINAMPEQMAIAADKIVEAQDWPGSEEIARRLRKALPPGTVPQDELSQEEMQQQAAAAEVAQKQSALAEAMAVAEVQKKNVESEELTARTELARAQTQKTLAEIGMRQAEVEAKVKSTRLNDSLEAIRVAHEGEEESDDAGED